MPVEMEVVDDELVLTVDHRSGDFKAPILVDPVIEQFNFNWSGGCADLSFWEWNSPWTNKFFKGCSYSLATQAYGGNYYGMSEYGQWIWRAPSNTFIEWAEFSGSDFAHSDGGYTATCATRGRYYAKVDANFSQLARCKGAETRALKLRRDDDR